MYLVEGANCHLVRVRTAASQPETVYVLGYGDDPSDSVTKPFVMRSANLGYNWSQFWINEPLTEREYTVTYKKTTKNAVAHVKLTGTTTHERVGDDEPGQTKNPWAMAFRASPIGDWPDSEYEFNYNPTNRRIHQYKWTEGNS